MSIQLKSKSEVKLELINSIIDDKDNGKINHIYKYTYTDGCVNFLKTSDTQKYISIAEDNVLYIINLTDEDFDHEIKELTENISVSDIELLTTPLEELRKLEKKIKIEKISRKIEILKNFEKFENIKLILYKKCFNEIDLKNPKDALSKLNDELGCIDYKLEIDYVFKMEDNTEITSYLLIADSLILCLFKGNKCISSLVIDYNNEDKSIVISSKTKEEYEKKDINKLLRSVMFIISKSIFPDAENILSHSINPISLNIMIKYFNAECIDDFICTAELNDVNIDNARKVFYDVIKKNKLECRKKGGKKQKNTKKKKEKRKNTKKKKYYTFVHLHL